ncbi:MAG: hypothetical protein R3181_10885, partial [Rubricoccaceae bacterium]|nr:hypothetical protein [Rubricoccaceae bacterium]
APFELPTSVAWWPDSLGGRLAIVDTRRGSLHVLSPEGEVIEERTPDGLRYPYLAGLRADTVVLHNRGERRLDFVVGDRSVRRIPLEQDYGTALATGDGLWAKQAVENDTYLARLDADGTVGVAYPLPQPYWRHVGFLRVWGDSLLSLSGYRPVVDVLPLGAPAGAAPDTLALVGFDSPQLVRSYQFLIDEVDEPPLLTPSAVPLGDRLFVLNIRYDAIRIDVYGRGGRLQRALVLPAADLLADVFPVDLAVREVGGALHIAVVLQHPGGFLDPARGRVAMLAWEGGTEPSALPLPASPSP